MSRFISYGAAPTLTELVVLVRVDAAYFRYRHSAQRFSKIRQYARMRPALFVSKTHRRSHSFGWPARVALTVVGSGLQDGHNVAEQHGGFLGSGSQAIDARLPRA